MPEENLLGERGRGYANFLSHPRRGPHRDRRAGGRRRAGLRGRVGAYAKEREAFGGPIGRNQAIAFKIARMEARAHTARTAYYDAARLMLPASRSRRQAAIAKLVAGEAAMDNARDATQVFGGYGFMNEYPVARLYRDAKILEIGERDRQRVVHDADDEHPGAASGCRVQRQPATV